MAGAVLLVVLSVAAILLADATPEQRPGFAGTEAEHWADGEAGLRATDARPEFAAAHEEVRKFLATSRFSRRVLTTHDPDPVVALVAPPNRDRVREGVTSGQLATLLREGTELQLVTPKVDGRMTATSSGTGAVVVRTVHTFAYAFDTPRGRVEFVHLEAVFWHDDRGLQVMSWAMSSDSCLIEQKPMPATC